MKSPAAVIVPRAGVVLVEVFVRAAEVPMIVPVLSSAVETLGVRTVVGSVDPPMQLPVLCMVACVFVEVVVAFVGQGRRGSYSHRQCRGRHQGFRHGHGGSPIRVCANQLTQNHMVENLNTGRRPRSSEVQAEDTFSSHLIIETLNRRSISRPPLTEVLRPYASSDRCTEREKRMTAALCEAFDGAQPLLKLLRAA